MREVIQEFETEIAAANTFDSLIGILSAFAIDFGFNKAVYGYNPRPKALDGTFRLPPILEMRPLDKQIDHLYVSRKYFKCDPIVHKVAETTLPVHWSFAQDQVIEGLEVHNTCIMAEMRKVFTHHGLHHGITVPLHLPHRELAWIGVLSYGSFEEFQNSASRYSDVLLVLAHHFHKKVQELGQQHETFEEKRVGLSGREVECLHWAAQGKTTEIIAEILGIADITVRFHMKNASSKLYAVNRAHAVAKATYLGLVSPSD